MSALRFIKEVDVQANSSIVSVTDVFSSDFDVYQIYVTKVSTVGTSQTGLDMRFITPDGSIIANNQYDTAFQTQKGDSSFTENKETSQSEVDNFFGIADQSSESQGCVATIYNPFGNERTYVTARSTSTVAGVLRGYSHIGILKYQTSVTGFAMLTTESRPFQTGIIKCYGIRVDS